MKAKERGTIGISFVILGVVECRGLENIFNNRVLRYSLINELIIGISACLIVVVFQENK